MGVRERGDHFRRLARSAITDLFDQRRPFGRLALTHVLMTAGDTLFAISLAGSLFFSISPTAAKDKVLLYLLLTMAPFAVVAPALGPLIDRSRGARRAMVMASALGRAVLCLFVARDIHSLLLFPEAFIMLVLSKVYLVTKGALVPEMAMLEMRPGGGTGDDIGTSDLGAPDGPEPDRDRDRDRDRFPVAGADDPYPTPPYGSPAAGTSGTSGTVGAAGTSGTSRPVRASGAAEPALGAGDVSAGTTPGELDLATLNARLGLLASLSAFSFALPGVAILKLFGAPALLWVDVGIFAVAVVSGGRLPVRRPHPAGRTAGTTPPGRIEFAPDTGRSPGAEWWAGDEADLAAFRPIADSEVILALMPMSVLKALLGFFTFLLAFGLRRDGAATWWFGLLLGALTAGALIGVLAVGRLRRVLSEQQILTGALLLVAVIAVLGAVFPSRWFEAVVALAVGVAGAVAKPSFDALVQRHVREADRGRAFAQFETQLQLLWVVGSFVPVVLALPVAEGNLVMALVAAVGAASYVSSRRSRGSGPTGSGSGHLPG